MRFTAYLTEADERPLLAFVRGSGGRIIHLFAPVWPPVPLETAPRTLAADECLAIWYPELIDTQELMLPDCHPEKGPHGCYNAWPLPFITFQRQWYWKKQATIFAVELDYRSFRPNRPDDAEFPPEEIAEFERRLANLIRKAELLREWCAAHLRYGYIGEGAWRESEELRSFAEQGRPGRRT